MSVTYSTIKALTEPSAMAELLGSRVIEPGLPDWHLMRVRTRPGRRFEAPRVLWNVYEAEIEQGDGSIIRPLFWTKVFFDDEACRQYHKRIDWLLQPPRLPSDPAGAARFFPEYNLFLFFFPADPVFPQLGRVFDPQAMGPVLKEHFQRVGYRSSALSAERIKYLPEISAIARYRMDAPEGTPVIFGKVQHSGKGALTYEVMRALWALPARAAGELVIAEPLAYLPEYDLLLQSEVRGDEVKGDRHSEVFMAQAEAAGRTIGWIHRSGISAGQPHTVDVEIKRLANRLEEFKLSSPNLYLMLRDLLTQVEARAARTKPEAVVPSHGDYKYNQFLFDGSRFGLIDVENFVQAEPSFDLGKYCGHLVPSMPEHWSDTVQANQARRIFLNAYQSIVPDYDGRRFPLYESLSLATRALVLTWSQTTNWEHTARTLVALAFERLKTRWGE